jgi:3-phosphoshikimate 1-carboxyvinyltransferase
MSKITIKPSIARGKVVVPPSKSYTHRMLIASGLSSDEAVVKNVDINNDIKATINCLETLGKEVTILDGEYNKTLIIKNSQKELADELVFDCLESGSTLRFFIPIALLTGKKIKFIGTEKLLSRGLSVYEDICLEQNILYTKTTTSITFEGKSFYRYMVRNLVGAMIEVGRGKINLDYIREMLYSNEEKHSFTAPACGLYLDFIQYN